MATSIWKGHLTFGLVSIPVKLYRAARAEKVGFGTFMKQPALGSVKHCFVNPSKG